MPARSSNNEGPVEGAPVGKPWSDICHVLIIMRNGTQLAQAQVSTVNTRVKLSQWAIDSTFIPNRVESVRFEIEWTSKNGQETEWVTKDAK